ncbi:hypothetical protein [Streptomyces sp. 900105245]
MPVPVRPAVAGMRWAVFAALALAGRFPHTSALADSAVAGVSGIRYSIDLDIYRSFYRHY